MHVTVISVFLFSLLLSACKGPNGVGGNAAAPPVLPPPQVKASQPRQETVTDRDEYTGRIEALETVTLKSRVNGYLTQVNFRAGDKVRKGDLLFVIDPRPYQAELARAESELRRVQTRLHLAESELRRARPLVQARAMSVEEQEARDQAVQEARAAADVAAAAVQLARLNFEFTAIRAPISGRIGRELITVGNLVRADDSVLTVIVSTDPVHVYLEADERAVLKYRRMAESGLKGAGRVRSVPAELGLIDETGFPHQGHIDYSEPRLDSQTGSLTLRGVFPNPSELLTPGFFARIRLAGGQPHPALLLPERAIGVDQDQRFVWVLKPDDSVEYRLIKPGSRRGSDRVVLEGLSQGDWVITEGLQKIRPGMTVKPERLAATPAG